MIRVGIVDDHQIVINGLSKIIDSSSLMTVVIESTDGNSVLNRNTLDNLDVLLLDIEMPAIDGVDVATKILEIDPEFKIIMLTMYNDIALAYRLQELGVKAYIHKTIEEQKLLKIIEQVYKNGTYFKILRTEAANNEYADVKIFRQEKFKDLSDRELEILRQVVKGFSNQQIGEQLHISHRTVDTHRTNIMRKLKVTNVASLVRVALKSGISI